VGLYLFISAAAQTTTHDDAATTTTTTAAESAGSWSTGSARWPAGHAPRYGTDAVESELWPHCGRSQHRLWNLIWE